MSVSKSQQLSECQHCQSAYSHGYDGQYCSEECFHSRKGDKALNQLRQDHRLCGTCGGTLKNVEPPTEDWEHEHGSRVQVALNHGGKLVDADEPGTPYGLDLTECADRRATATDSVIGFQYRTPEAEDALKEVEGPNEYARILHSTTGCICGSTDHTKTEDILRECDPVRVLTKYTVAFRKLYRTGAIDRKIDKRTFFNSYKESRDFELALGRALYEGDAQ
jgi:hypothetical protein